MKNAVTVSLFLLVLALPLVAQEDEASGATAKGSAVDTTGKGYTAAYVIESSTRRVLFAENEHVPLPTASMAKMMTLLIVMEEIRAGNLTMDAPVNISARASQMGGSQVYLKAASVWPVKNLIIATMVQSANDAAQALAEKVAGSSEAFADMMNQRSKELGLTHSKFFDPHGLPNPNPQLNDVMCAHDLAILGGELMKYKEMRTLARIPEMEFRNGTLERIYNPNHLVNPRKANYYDAATGIKTGYSGPAGYCITASAFRNNMELIAVVMGAKPPKGELSSFGIASRLFNEAYASNRMQVAAKSGAVVGQAPVTDGQAKTVPAVAGQDVRALVKRGEESSIKVAFSGGPVTAPVKKGQNIGKIIVTQGTQQIATVPAVAGADVEKQAWYRKFLPF